MTATDNCFDIVASSHSELITVNGTGGRRRDRCSERVSAKSVHFQSADQGPGSRICFVELSQEPAKGSCIHGADGRHALLVEAEQDLAMCPLPFRAEWPEGPPKSFHAVTVRDLLLCLIDAGWHANRATSSGASAPDWVLVPPAGRARTPRGR